MIGSFIVRTLVLLGCNPDGPPLLSHERYIGQWSLTGPDLMVAKQALSVDISGPFTMQTNAIDFRISRFRPDMGWYIYLRQLLLNYRASFPFLFVKVDDCKTMSIAD
jgi:hypothetical protein